MAKRHEQAGRIGGYQCFAKHGPSVADAAHAGFLARFEREVDPDGTLDPADRARRAQAALRAYMVRLAMRRHK